MSHVKTVRDRYQWMEAVLADPKLTPAAKCVGIRLILHLNLTTGRCNPSYETIEDGTDIWRSSVVPAIKTLQTTGWIEIEGGRGRNSKRYSFLMRPSDHTAATVRENGPLTVRPDGPLTVRPDGPLTVRAGGRSDGADCVSTVQFNDPNGPNSGPSTVRPDGPLTVQFGVGVINRDSNREENREENRGGESLPTALSPSDDAVDTEPQIEAEVSQSASGFDEWWKQYPKKVARGAARRAYERAVESGKATAEELLTGVMRYAAERIDQDPKYTKHPATWLNKECWLDEGAPEPRASDRTIDEAGNDVPPPRTRDLPPPRSWLEIAERSLAEDGAD